MVVSSTIVWGRGFAVLLAVGAIATLACSTNEEGSVPDAGQLVDGGGDVRRSPPTGPDEETRECRASVEVEVPVPVPYAGRVNPLAPTTAALTAGRATYAATCADCHGPGGRGDGRRAPLQKIAPTDFTRRSRPADYLFWRISEGGGEPFCSSMPTGKAHLSEPQRWQLVLVLEEFFAAPDGGTDGGT